MKDPYDVLGVTKTATQEEVKSAYRKLAMTHHPDRGGDENVFKEIGDAYAIIGNANKRKELDNNQDTFRKFNFREGDDFSQTFNDFFRHTQRQTTLRMNLVVDLKTVATGGKRLITLQTKHGNKALEIEIPLGIEDNTMLRYPQLVDGDDLQVTFRVQPDPNWVRNDLDLITEYKLDFWDFIVGTKISVDTITNQTILLTIPEKTQPGSLMRILGKGIQGKYNRQGDMYVKLLAELPKNLPDSLVTTIKGLQK